MSQSIDPTALLEALNDAVVACDEQGAIVFWNAAAERIFGFTREEAMGQSLDIIIPQRLRARHWEGYDKTMETGHTKYAQDTLRVPAVDKAGRSLSIAFTVAMLFKADGKPGTVVSVIRDETQRFAEDRALRKRLAELEAAAKGPA